ncbi:MAG: hypothetical protein ACR2O3_07725 [Rhizobiaceae bacterium]
MRLISVISTSLVMQLFAATLYAAESKYTDLDLNEDCVFHSEYEQGASAYCSGYKGYPVHFDEGDLRQMVRFGHLKVLKGQWESFGQFNRINNKIEWRLNDGKPYAAILRWFIENSNSNGEYSKALEGQVLVISKVADHDSPASCVVGYVDARANSNSNELARKIADTIAPGFKCFQDGPDFHGKRGKYSGDPVISHQ